MKEVRRKERGRTGGRNKRKKKKDISKGTRKFKNSPKETVLQPETAYPQKSIPKQELELKCVIYPEGWTMFGQMQGRTAAFGPQRRHLCSFPGNYWAPSLVWLAHRGSRATFTICDENFVNSVQAWATQPEHWVSSHGISKSWGVTWRWPRRHSGVWSTCFRRQFKLFRSTGFYKKVAWDKFA